MAASHEAEHLRHVINNLESSIAVAKSLRRIKSRYLDAGTKIEVDLAITSSEDVLHTVDRTIEGYGSHPHTKGIGHLKPRRDWLLRSHPPPASNGPTPASCLERLTTHIKILNAIQPPQPPQPPPPVTDNVKTHMPPAPLPGYRDSLAPQTQGLRAPSLRKLRSRRSIFNTGAPTSMASTSTLSVVTEIEGDFLHTRIPDDDTSSSFSYDDQTTTSSSCTGDSSMSSATSYGGMSCTGRYCTLEYCGNHGGAGAADEDDDLPAIHSLNFDPGYSDKISVSDPPLTTGSWNNTSLRPPSRRKKGRSGFV